MRTATGWRSLISHCLIVSCTSTHCLIVSCTSKYSFILSYFLTSCLFSSSLGWFVSRCLAHALPLMVGWYFPALTRAATAQPKRLEDCSVQLHLPPHQGRQARSERRATNATSSQSLCGSAMSRVRPGSRCSSDLVQVQSTFSSAKRAVTQQKQDKLHLLRALRYPPCTCAWQADPRYSRHRSVLQGSEHRKIRTPKQSLADARKRTAS